MHLEFKLARQNRNYAMIMLRRWAIQWSKADPKFTSVIERPDTETTDITVELEKPSDYTMFILTWDQDMVPYKLRYDQAQNEA